MAASNNKVGLADALRQRELDEQERDSSDGNGDWDDDAADVPAAKSNVPVRKLGPRPGERPAPAPPATRPASKPQPTGASGAEKRGQSDLESSDASPNKSKSSRACESYEIDMAATEYGMCKCGFKKNEHVQGPMFRAAPRAMGSVYHPEVTKAPPAKPASFATSEKTSPLESARKSFSPRQTETKVPDASASHSEEPADEKRPCDAFEVDLLSSEFGMCKCGFKKAQHSKSAQTAAPRRPSGLGFISVQAAEKLAQEERQREQEEAAKKAEEEARAKQEFMERERKLRELEEAGGAESHHDEAAAAADQGVGEPESDSGDIKRACDSFEIDLNAKEFGMCKCGFKKGDHTKTSLFSKPLPKPVHGYAPIEVPNIGKAATKSHNRPPPAFATSAPSKPVPPPAKHEETSAAPVAEHEEETVPEHQDVPVAEHVELETEGDAFAADDHSPDAGESTQFGDDADAPIAVLKVFDTPQPYKALYDYEGAEIEDLTFQAGEEIEVLELIDEEWMRGRIGDRSGVFPSNYVTKMEKEDSVVDEAEPASITQKDGVLSVEGEAASAEALEAPTEVEPESEAAAEPVAEPEQTVEDYNAAAEDEAVMVDMPAVEEPAEEEAHTEEPMIEETMAETIPVEEEAAAAEVQEGVPFTVYALFDFGAAEEDLHFKAGDVIEVIAIVDDEWWRGTIEGREGIFPCNYVTKDANEAPLPVEGAHVVQAGIEPVSGGAVLGVVEALYDMVVETEGDLNFRTGDKIEIIEIIDDDWYRGVLDGQEGNVPRVYVTELSS